MVLWAVAGCAVFTVPVTVFVYTDSFYSVCGVLFVLLCLNKENKGPSKPLFV